MRWLTLLLVACSAGSPGPGIDIDRAMGHVSALVAIGPRPANSPASTRAAEYIEGQLTALGVPFERFSVGTVELPEIRVLGALRRRAKQVSTVDPDLVVRFGPPGKALLVMAHYDTVPPSPGAVDNAAAVGVLLELARVLHDAPPAHPVMLMFTADEEQGLVGAEAFAEQRGSEVDFAVALDLVGGSGALVLNGASKLIGSAEMHWIADAARRAGVVLRAPLPHRVISRWWPEAERSDHGAFTRRGIRAVHFYDRGQDGEWIDLAYHSAADVPSRIDRGSLDELGRLLVALAATPPPPHDGDGFWLPLATDTVVPRWTIVLFDGALAVVALLLLASAIAGARRTARSRGAGLFAALACFAIAAAGTAAIERLIAGAHPAPWLHAPLRAELAETLVLAGALGLVSRAIARVWPWTGSVRYLAIAIAPPAAVGIFWLACGAAELAWVWLVPAALAAIAPRLGRFAPVAIAGTLLTPALVLAPSQLREAAWNGFLPLSLPLAAWLALLLGPTFAAVAWWLRRPAGPLRTLVLPLGSALAIASGLVLLLATPSTCSAADFQHFHLACELGGTWR